MLCAGAPTVLLGCWTCRSCSAARGPRNLSRSLRRCRPRNLSRSLCRSLGLAHPTKGATPILARTMAHVWWWNSRQQHRMVTSASATQATRATAASMMMMLSRRGSGCSLSCCCAPAARSQRSLEGAHGLIRLSDVTSLGMRSGTQKRRGLCWGSPLAATASAAAKFRR